MGTTCNSINQEAEKHPFEKGTVVPTLGTADRHACRPYEPQQVLPLIQHSHCRWNSQLLDLDTSVTDGLHEGGS
jgi:hypothetical protein